jgi:hypothetical protein
MLACEGLASRDHDANPPIRTNKHYRALLRALGHVDFGELPTQYDKLACGVKFRIPN